MKVQICQLETTLKGDLADKVTLQDALEKERERFATLESDFKDIQARSIGLK